MFQILFCCPLWSLSSSSLVDAFSLATNSIRLHPHARHGKEQQQQQQQQELVQVQVVRRRQIQSSSFSSSLLPTSTASATSLSSTTSSSSYEMPWSTHQEWALQDKISKYTINIPRLNNPTLEGGGINKTTFALWYTMRNEVTEIMGYEIDYLHMKYAALLDDDQGGDDNVKTATTTATDIGKTQNQNPPGILPFIDEFEFRKNGGIKGKVYGLVGIEPGTEIVTSPLKDVELTLPKGFVLTHDCTCAYELGTSTSSATNANNLGVGTGAAATVGYPMDLSNMKEDGANLVSNVSQQSGQIVSNVANELRSSDSDTSQMIVNLASTTAVVLGAATAMNMLSHHLTVNVFWV